MDDEPAPGGGKAAEVAGAPVRVLWLTKGLGLGGSERLLAGSLAHVDPARYQVEVAYLLPWKDALVPEIEDRGVPVHCLGGGHPLDFRWAARLRKLVADRDYELIHTHAPYPALAARLALGRHRRPAIVHTEHNCWPRYRPGTRWANALTYGRNDMVVAVSQAVANSIGSGHRRGGRFPPIEVLVHGVDLDVSHRGGNARARARATLGLGPDDVTIGSVGNFTSKKDHRSLLAAAAVVAHSQPGLRVVLVGSGPLEDELRSEARRLGLDDRVMFTGSRDDVLAILPAFDLFVLSSRHEGLPISLLEAMATGLACVVTEVGGIPEVVTDGVEGLVVPPGQPAALASSICALLADPGRRAAMGAAAIDRSAGYDLARAVARTQDIYDGVLGLTAMADSRR